MAFTAVAALFPGLRTACVACSTKGYSYGVVFHWDFAQNWCLQNLALTASTHQWSEELKVVNWLSIRNEIRLAGLEGGGNGERNGLESPDLELDFLQKKKKE